MELIITKPINYNSKYSPKILSEKYYRRKTRRKTNWAIILSLRCHCRVLFVRLAGLRVFVVALTAPRALAWCNILSNDVLAALGGGTTHFLNSRIATHQQRDHDAILYHDQSPDHMSLRLVTFLRRQPTEMSVDARSLRVLAEMLIETKRQLLICRYFSDCLRRLIDDVEASKVLNSFWFELFGDKLIFKSEELKVRLLSSL